MVEIDLNDRFSQKNIQKNITCWQSFCCLYRSNKDINPDDQWEVVTYQTMEYKKGTNKQKANQGEPKENPNIDLKNPDAYVVRIM